MGQRANLIIIRDGDWLLYYDHWCANRLDVELFWGPGLATAYVEQRSPLADRNDWLDERWCEGGAIIDHDQRVLTWFGGDDIEYDVPRRRALLALMQHQWAGWQVRWAVGSIVELGAYLGFSADKFLVASPNAAFRLFTESPEDNNMLLTVREEGRTSVVRLRGDEEALESGEGQLSTLLGLPKEPTLDWTGEMPEGGLHLDLDQRALYYWLAMPSNAIEDRVSRAWPAWRCQWLRDRFEVHLTVAAADIRLPVRGVEELQHELLGRLRRCCVHAAGNPVRDLAPRLGALGMGVTDINPCTDEGRGSLGDEAKKQRILDELERLVPLFLIPFAR